MRPAAARRVTQRAGSGMPEAVASLSVSPPGPSGLYLAEALAADGIHLSPDDASELTRALFRLAELGALVGRDRKEN